MEARSTTLVISNIAWDFVWQRHQTLATLFAQDTDVIFCEVPGIRRVGWRDVPRLITRLLRFTRSEKNSRAVSLPARLRIARPFVVPATNRFFCRVNVWLLERWLAREPELRQGVDLVLNYSASRTARQLMDRVPHRQLVYDCTDDWLAVRGIPAFVAEDERALLARADLTLVPSRALLERKRPTARRIMRMPHGALVERFLLPVRARAGNVPVALLYYGHLHRQHLDFELLIEVARSRPHWTLTLVGPVKTPAEFPSNVRLVGQQPHAALREFIVSADVLLLPYVINEYTRAVLPAKIFECLASGRPIVATPLPELVAEFSGQLRFAEDAGGFVAAVETALIEDTPDNAAARVALARANSWEERYRQIRAVLNDLPKRDAP